MRGHPERFRVLYTYIRADIISMRHTYKTNPLTRDIEKRSHENVDSSSCIICTDRSKKKTKGKREKKGEKKEGKKQKKTKERKKDKK